jgi:flavin reductase (DIM6/NTAB) family NADH-FMN oxidoreductase RutF/rubredoxin
MASQKDAFHTLTYGLYLVTSAYEAERNAYIANTVFQVSSDPPFFAISCHKDNYSTGLIWGGKSFGVSVLQQDTPLEFIQKYGYSSGKSNAKFSGLNFRKGITGVPLVYDHSVAWFECQVENRYDVGTHWLFTGKVIDYGILSSFEEPLDYRWYRREYRVASPPKSPTYVSDDNGLSSDGASTLPSYACAICEYIYHPKRGDATKGIPPGTSFDDLPDDWVCPVCGAGKVVFTETSGGY